MTSPAILRQHFIHIPLLVTSKYGGFGIVTPLHPSPWLPQTSATNIPMLYVQVTAKLHCSSKSPREVSAIAINAMFIMSGLYCA